MEPRLGEEVDELDTAVLVDDQVLEELEAWLMENLRDLGLGTGEE